MKYKIKGCPPTTTNSVANIAQGFFFACSFNEGIQIKNGYNYFTDHSRICMVVIGEAPITQLRTCVIKVVTLVTIYRD